MEKTREGKVWKGDLGESQILPNLGEVTNQYYYITDIGTKSGISEDPGKPVTSSYKIKWGCKRN